MCLGRMMMPRGWRDTAGGPVSLLSLGAAASSMRDSHDESTFIVPYAVRTSHSLYEADLLLAVLVLNWCEGLMRYTAVDK